jgi:predicted NAD/FAD-binding protein
MFGWLSLLPHTTGSAYRPFSHASVSTFSIQALDLMLASQCAHWMFVRQRRHWSSWNVLQDDDTTSLPVLTYWLKNLQHIKEDNLFISLNPPPEFLEKPCASVIHHRQVAHPILDIKAIQAQRLVWQQHQGKGSLWYAGQSLSLSLSSSRPDRPRLC